MFAYWLLIFQHQAFAADPYSTALKRYNAHAHQPLVSLSRSNRLQLEKGDVVVSLDKSDRGWRASAMIVIQGSLEEIWIASRDQCQKQQKSTLEYVVNDYGGGSED